MISDMEREVLELTDEFGKSFSDSTVIEILIIKKQ
jgi:hypothetical protein